MRNQYRAWARYMTMTMEDAAAQGARA